MTMNDYEEEEEEMYLYLDFKGRLPPETFNSQVFFNITNLNTKHPLVQVGQSVFHGTYEDCVGTNIFFEEEEESPRQLDILGKQTPISLKYVTKQCKILNLQWAKVPEEVSIEDTDECNVQFNEDYEMVLKKLEKDALEIDDFMQVQKKDRQRAIVSPEPELPTESKSEDLVINNETLDVIVQKCTKFDLLTFLAQERLKRVMPEEIFHIPDHLRTNYAYHSFKNKLMQENRLFEIVLFIYDRNTLEDVVDINRCIRQGLIKDTSHLTEEEKQLLLNIRNYENLSLLMRYCTIRSLMKKQKRFIRIATEKQLQETTELGVDVRNSYKVMKVIAEDMKKLMLTKHRNIRRINTGETVEEINSDASEKTSKDTEGSNAASNNSA